MYERGKRTYRAIADDVHDASLIWINEASEKGEIAMIDAESSPSGSNW